MVGTPVATLGPFELIRKLGAGATAEVFLSSGPNAHNEELIALKVMLPHLAEDEGTRRAFLHEGRTSELLLHPNIVEVFDVGEVEGRAYLAMELVRGWSVWALMKKLRAAKEPLPIDEGCEIIRQAALGLHFAHEIRGVDGQPMGLVHRDVSPQNLIVSERGAVKVADFGLAKATAAQATVTRGIKGKMKYMPPEQLKGEALDRRSDVFALGAVLWELVIGQPLYPGNGEAEIFQQALFLPQPHPDEVAQGLSRAVVEVLQRCVERQPDRRIASALLLAELLLPLTVPQESAARLGARIGRHFEPLPRSLAEATGNAPPLPPNRKRTGLPAPPPRLKPPPPVEARASDTIASLPPVASQTSEPTNPSLSPVDTLAEDGEGITRARLGTVRSKKRWLVPCLVLAGLALLITLVVSASRVLKEQNEPRYSFEQTEGGAVSSTGRKPEGFHGTVTIDANVPARVSLGGREFGMTPVRVTLAPGKHRLRVATPDGTLSTDVEVVIVAGGSSRKTVQLR